MWPWFSPLAFSSAFALFIHIQWWHALLCGWGIHDPSSHPDAFPSKTPGATLKIVELMDSNNRTHVEDGGRLLAVLRSAGTTCLRTDVQHGCDHVFWATSWPLGAQETDASSKEGCFYLRAVTRYVAFMQGYRIHQGVLLSVGQQPTQYRHGKKDDSQMPDINFAPLLLEIEAGYELKGVGREYIREMCAVPYYLAEGSARAWWSWIRRAMAGSCSLNTQPVPKPREWREQGGTSAHIAWAGQPRPLFCGCPREATFRATSPCTAGLEWPHPRWIVQPQHNHQNQGNGENKEVCGQGTRVPFS